MFTAQPSFVRRTQPVQLSAMYVPRRERRSRRRRRPSTVVTRYLYFVVFVVFVIDNVTHYIIKNLKYRCRPTGTGVRLVIISSHYAAIATDPLC